MNRVIKFRAWSPEEKKMYTPILTENGKAATVWYGYEIQGETDDPVMQFTGLHDRNGKEIYEGCIITDDSVVDDFGTPCRALVGFSSGSFRVERTNCACGCLNKIIEDGAEYTVIGNIYENADLLNGVNHD